MFLIKNTDPKDATGELAEFYNSFPGGMDVPKYLQLVNVSEPLFGFQAQLIGWWMDHSKFNPKVLSAIRYLMADACDNTGCDAFNSMMLLGMGVTTQELEAMKKAPLDGPFEARENALLDFAITAMKNPEGITQDTIDNLREMDWADQDIFEVANHAAGLLAPTALVKAFSK